MNADYLTSIFTGITCTIEPRRVTQQLVNHRGGIPNRPSVFLTTTNNCPHTTASQLRLLSGHFLPVECGQRKSGYWYPFAVILLVDIIADSTRSDSKSKFRAFVALGFFHIRRFGLTLAITSPNRTAISSPSAKSSWPNEGLVCGYRPSSEDYSNSHQWTSRQ